MIDLPQDIAESLKKQSPNLFSELVEQNEYRLVEGDVKGRNILDVGANIGYFSIIAAHLGARMVLSFEPNRESFDKLVLNTKRFENIHPLRFALDSGVVSGCETVGSGTVCETRPSLSGTTPIISLLQAVALFPSSDSNMVLKMDVEGAEFNILYYAGGAVLRRFSTVFIEVHAHKRPEDLRALKRFFEFLGYKMVAEVPQCWWEYGPDGKVLSCTPLDVETLKYELQK